MHRLQWNDILIYNIVAAVYRVIVCAVQWTGAQTSEDNHFYDHRQRVEWNVRPTGSTLPKCTDKVAKLTVHSIPTRHTTNRAQ